jgi:hypothetical protein
MLPDGSSVNALNNCMSTDMRALIDLVAAFGTVLSEDLVDDEMPTEVADTTAAKSGTAPKDAYNPYSQFSNMQTDTSTGAMAPEDEPELGSEQGWKEFRAFGSNPPAPIPTETYPTMALPIPNAGDNSANYNYKSDIQGLYGTKLNYPFKWKI